MSGGNLKGQWIAPSFIAAVQSAAAAQDRMAGKPSVRRGHVEQLDAYRASIMAKHGLLPGDWPQFHRLRASGVGATRAAYEIRYQRAKRERRS